MIIFEVFDQMLKREIPLPNRATSFLVLAAQAEVFKNEITKPRMFGFMIQCELTCRRCHGAF